MVEYISPAPQPEQPPDRNNEGIRLTSFHINSTIRFRYSRTEVTALYKNPNTRAGKAVFNMVLPKSAFISNFSMTIKDEEYVAEVKEKEEAEKTYDSAVASGNTAGLVSKNKRDSNHFSVDTNLEPGEKVVFTLTYEEQLERQDDQYEYVLHIDPGVVLDDFHVEVNINESLPLTELSVPELLESNELDFNQLGRNSNTGQVTREVGGSPHNARVVFSPSKEEQLEAGDHGVSGKFVVRYDVDRQGQDTEVQVIDGYFVHYFVPNDLEPLPKHVLYVLDVSGSMQGEKLEQMKDAMFTVLDDMTESEYFNIITFNDEVNHWNRELNQFINESSNFYQASEDNKNTAITSILNLLADSGTDINAGILSALEEGKEAKKLEVLPDDVKTMVVFLTDGRPSSGVVDANEIKSNIKNFNKDIDIPIFTIAFGEDADFGLIRDIAVENEGRAKRVYEGSDAALQLEDFYSQIASPLLSKLNFQYVGGLVQNDSLSHLETNTLFKGKEFIVTGKLGENNDDSGDDQVSVIIDAGGKYYREFDICLRSESNLNIDEQAKLSLSNSTAVDEKEMLTPVSTLCFRPRAYPKSEAQNFLKNLHAFLNIKQLQQSIQVASNELAKEELRKKALDLSLKNNFVTDLTSLVVTKPDEEPVINKLVTDLFTEDDLIPVAFSASSSLISSRNKINRPSPSVSLGLRGNGLQFDPRYASVSYSSRPSPRPGITNTTKYYLTTTTTTSTSTTTQQPSTDLFDLIATDYNNDT